VPVYAHPLELPYLTGRSKYPPPDPSVGGGAQSWLSPLFSRGPIDLGARVHGLPARGVVPWLAEWTWIPTPGHSPGHVSLFREDDGVLIAGDAVVTTRQESMINVALQRAVVSRPPAYFTQDWEKAERSVRDIAALDPDVLATGHGPVMRGSAMRRELRDLADRFDRAVPSSGRYVEEPARADRTGLVWVPPRRAFAATPAGMAALGLGVVIAAGLAARAMRNGRA
jgi:glyoxylase-like metal-dependent hydrolase (beta-lactamase superfamily II)